MGTAASLADAKALLDDIRYRSSPISFATRNHFAEAQWLPANEAKGYLQEETTRLDPRAPSATLVLRRERWSKVKGLERLTTAEIPEGEFSIRYLPLAEARKLAARFAPGSVLDRKSTRLNSSHQIISYAVFCLKKKNTRSTPICNYPQFLPLADAPFITSL